jgi:hypothetical protein
VPWQVPRRQQAKISAYHKQQARHSTRKFAEATGAKPPDPKTPLVQGTLHETLADYRKEREKEVALPNGAIDATGHYLLGLVDCLPKAHPNMPLNMLDLGRCKELTRISHTPIEKGRPSVA